MVEKGDKNDRLAIDRYLKRKIGTIEDSGKQDEKICPSCGGVTEYTLWNTEKGDDEGYHCLECDGYFPNLKARRQGVA